MGSNENPIVEMELTAEVGDNIHDICFIECLHADTHLFFTMPAGRSLRDVLSHQRQAMTETKKHTIFCKILKILSYLRDKCICWQDRKPKNLVVLPDHDDKHLMDNLVAVDLGMAVRMPSDGTLLSADGCFGTCVCMAPEIRHQEPHCDGPSVDLWAAMVILHELHVEPKIFLFSHVSSVETMFGLALQVIDSKEIQNHSQFKNYTDEINLHQNGLLPSLVRLFAQYFCRNWRD